MMINKTKFLNFVPTDGFKLYVNDLINKIVDASPADANTQSEIDKKDDAYACKIEIRSRAAHFAALAKAANPRLALVGARRSILRQLSKWHQRRFAEPPS